MSQLINRIRHANLFRLLSQIAVLALLYFIFAKLGGLLAVPPGYATIFWPASGIALAMMMSGGYAVWPGVFIGSFIFNYYVGKDVPNADYQVLVQNAALIALGSSLQTLAGTYMCRKLIARHFYFKSLKRIVLFLIIGGLITPLVAATIGVVTLMSSGVIAASNAGFLWVTWYIGDGLGIIVFTPIFVLLLAPGRHVSLRRKIVAILPILFVFGLCMTLFVLLSNRERSAAEDNFNKNRSAALSDFMTRIERNLNQIETLRDFYYSSVEVDRDEFVDFATPILERHTGIAAFAWLPAVPVTDLDGHLETARNIIGPEYAIKTIDQNDADYNKASRKTIYPVLYAVPTENAPNVWGLDISSSIIRYQALLKSRITGRLTITDAIRLYNDTEGYGFLALMPVYANNTADRHTDKSALPIEGFVSGVFRFNNIFNDYAAFWRSQGVYFKVKETRNDKLFNVPLYDSGQTEQERNVDNAAFTQPIIIDVGDHNWTIVYYMPESWLLSQKSYTQIFALLAGLLFTALAEMFILYVTGQNERISRQIESKTRELQSAVMFQSLIMDNVPDLIFIKDQNLVIIDANQAFVEFVGAAHKDEVINRTLIEKFNKDEAEHFIEQDRTTFETGYAETNERIVDADGKTRMLSTKKVRFQDKDGHYYLLAVARDITTIFESQRDLERHAKELEQKNADLKNFTYAASHDLKTPLRHMAMGVSMIKEMYGKEFDVNGTRLIDLMENACHRMQRLIEGVLEYAKLGQPSSVQKTRVDLKRLLNNTMSEYEDDLKENGGKISLSLGEASYTIQGNAGLLARLFENLIENAFKYTKQPPKVLIASETPQSPNTLLLSFSDNGIGIDPAYSHKIFEIFQRLHRDDEIAGSGIGLATCQRIAEIHGGRIWHDPDYVDGARFYVELALPNH